MSNCYLRNGQNSTYGQSVGRMRVTEMLKPNRLVTDANQQHFRSLGLHQCTHALTLSRSGGENSPV